MELDRHLLPPPGIRDSLSLKGSHFLFQLDSALYGGLELGLVGVGGDWPRVRG